MTATTWVLLLALWALLMIVVPAFFAGVKALDGEDAPPIRPIDDSCVPLPAAEAVEWAHQASATGLESTIAASEVSAHPPGPKAPTGPILR